MKKKRVTISSIEMVKTHYRLHKQFGLTFHDEDLEKYIERKRRSRKKYVKPYIVLLLNF